MTCIRGLSLGILVLVVGLWGCSSRRNLQQGYYEYKNGHFDHARPLLERSFNRNPSADAAFLIAESGRRLREQDTTWYNRAISSAKQEFVRSEEMSEKVVRMRIIALSYYHLKNYREALSWLDKLTMGVSTDPDVYFYLGHCAVELKDFDAAMVYLTKYDGLHNDTLRTLLERCKNRD